MIAKSIRSTGVASRLYVRTPLAALAMLAALQTVAVASEVFAAAGQAGSRPTTYSFKQIDYPGATGTYVYAVNDQDEVVGYYTGAACSQTSCGFTERNGKFSSIECALENATDFFDISNKNQIVGTYSYYGGVHGFIWEGNSSCFDIVDPSGASYTEAWGVNDSGQLVGFYSDSSGNYDGFLYVNGVYTTVDCPGEADTLAYGISDSGVIVGEDANSTAGPFSGFAYRSGRCTMINYPGASSTEAKGINKASQISGVFSDSAGTHGFVKTGTSYQEIDYPGATTTLGYHLNDKGQVAGWFTDSAGANHGFVATPQ